MQSRVHSTYKTQYRVANWASYDRALVRRGDVTVVVHERNRVPSRVGAQELLLPRVARTRALKCRMSVKAAGLALRAEPKYSRR